MYKQLVRSVIIVAVSTFAIPAAVSAAGNATLSFSAKDGNFAKGNSFTINILENSGAETINVVEANFLFDEARLQLVSKNCNTSVFGITAPGQGYGITCGSYSPVSGQQVVGSVTFKALTDGPVNVGFAHTSHVWESTNGTDIWNQAANYSMFTVYTPAAQPVAKKTVAPAVAAAQTPAAPVATEEVKTENAVNTNEQPAQTTQNQTVTPENDSVSVWAYLATFLAATALAAGIVYRDNLKKWASQLRNSFGGKAVPVAVAATATGKAKTTKKAPAKKKPAARKK